MVASGFRRKPREFTGAGAALSIVALLVLCAAFVLCALSFCAPFWVTHRTEYYDMGLWGKCFFNPEKAGRSGCRWMWDFDWALEKAQADTFKACQALFGLGIASLLVAFVIAMGQLCCDLGFGSSRLFSVNAGIILLSWTMMATSICMFGALEYMENQTSINSQVKRFGWAFIVGITGVVVTFAAAVLYALTDFLIRNTRREEGYKQSMAELRG